jgi:hypothetical protein
VQYHLDFSRFCASIFTKKLHTELLVGCFYILSGGPTLRLAKLFDFTAIGTQDTRDPMDFDPSDLGRDQVF